MRVRVAIVEGPLSRAKVAAGSGTGALVVFEGVVRRDEDGRTLRALDYQVYEPMASRQLATLARAMVRECGVLAVSVWHSRGMVRVGEVSFRLVIEGAHRREAIDATDQFIARMKRDVPIWKKPIFASPKRRRTSRGVPAKKRGGEKAEPTRQPPRKAARNVARNLARNLARKPAKRPNGGTAP